MEEKEIKGKLKGLISELEDVIISVEKAKQFEELLISLFQDDGVPYSTESLQGFLLGIRFYIAESGVDAMNISDRAALAMMICGKLIRERKKNETNLSKIKHE